MRALVVYESMFGNTHVVADHIGAGLTGADEVRVVPVHDASPDALDSIDLLVVGGPTHVHGMTSQRSRSAAVDMAHQPEAEMTLDPDAEGEGLREWFDGLPEMPGVRAAAFDTRAGAVAPIMSGRASKGIARRLRRHGFDLAAEPESFLVDEHNHLIDGEAERATQWASTLIPPTP